MKKAFLPCLVLCLFISCSKRDIQKWLNKPGNPTPSVPCRIDSIYPVTEGDPMLVSWVAAGVHYNDQGNPSFINYTQRYFNYSNFTVYYKYDSRNRLIEVDPPYVDPLHMEVSSISPVTAHKFVYEGNSTLPIRDSIISDTFYGVSEGVAYKVYTVKIEDLFYDEQGRINRVVSRRNFYNTRFNEHSYFEQEFKYSYDSKGNRQTISVGADNPPPAVVKYTNKPSLYSLHPVWQLVHRNWSKNAPEMNVQKYNNNGLPTRADMSREGFLETRMSNGSDPFFNIKYTCF